jgi:hypothetical protein
MGHTLDGTLEVFVFVAGKIFLEFFFLNFYIILCVDVKNKILK